MEMEAFFVLFLLILACLGFWFFNKRKPNALPYLQKGMGIGLIALSIISFFIYIPFTDIINFTIALNDGFDNITIVYLMSDAEIIFISILRWFTIAGIVSVAAAAIFDFKQFMGYFSLVFAPIILLNCLFFKLNLIALGGTNFSYFSFKSLKFLLEQICLGTLIFSFILNKDFDFKIKKQEVFAVIKNLGLVLILFLPLWTPRALFGYGNGITVGLFSLAHIAWILIIVLVYVATFYALKNKPFEDRRFYLILMSLSSFFQYFGGYIINGKMSFVEVLNELPFHICNMAMIIIPLAIILKNKILCYFALFINTTGAFLAILIPFSQRNIFSYWQLNFMYEHTYAAILPILFITLGIFDAPQKRDFINTLKIFGGYFLFVLLFNTIAVNFNSEVDYFYLVGSAMSDLSPIIAAIKSVKIEFSLGSLMISFYPIYQLLMLCGFCLLAFLTFIVSSKFFKRKKEVGSA